MFLGRRAVGKEWFSWVRWNLHYQAVGSQGYTFLSENTDILIFPRLCAAEQFMTHGCLLEAAAMQEPCGSFIL